MRALRLPSPITIFYAAPRSGKTYLAIESMLDSLKDGRKVITNIPNNIPGVYRFDERLLTGSPVYDSDIYIDEAYQYFSSRNFKSFGLQKHEFFSLCGHYGNRLVLIAQHPARLDKIIRENTSSFVMARAYRLPTGQPICFRYLTFDFDPCLLGSSSEVRRARPVDSTWVRFKKKTASLYDTHCLRPSDPELDLELWVNADAKT